MMARASVVRLFLCTMVLAARVMNAASHEPPRDPAGFERVLLPIAFESQRPGAFGSWWDVDLTVSNESDVPVQIFQMECAYFCECVGVTCSPPFEVSPGGRYRIEGMGDTHNLPNPGAFLYIGRSAGRLPIQLRLRDVSRSESSAGTEVPVVRDEDALSETAYLLDVPVQPGFRIHFRAYGLSAPAGEARLHVVIADADTRAVLLERTLELVTGTGDLRPEFPAETSQSTHPAFAEIRGLESLLPSARTLASLRIVITPGTSGLKYWAFVAITNNDTQQVTLVTPQ